NKGTLGVGHPGLSRKRAYEQRAKTIGVEYDRLGNVNKIIDKRIGEKNQEITKEEKASLRFTAERVKHLKKGSKFNLTDDNDDDQVLETLTHGGRELTTIQKYDKIIASDDEDDTGNIGADVVKAAHFGGGDLDSTRSSEKKLTRKDIIADLIAKTRQARENKQNAKDDMETATEELDAKYLKILDKVKNSFRPIGATKSEKAQKDDYDQLALSLKIDADARATPAERTKTAEELAAEEKHHLEELESLRLGRMNAEKNKRGHTSADADVSSGSKKKTKNEGFEVRFDSSGALIDKDKVERVTKKRILIDSDDELTDEELEDDNEEELDDLIAEHDDEQAESSTTADANMQEGSDEEDGDASDEEDAEIEDEDEEDEEDAGTEGDHVIEPTMSDKRGEKHVPTIVEEDLQIPFIFQMPTSFEALKRLLDKYPSNKLEIVLERLIKCHHPSLAEGNKKLLSKLFLYLLRFFDECAQSPLLDNSLRALGTLTK
ncbi:unnamed protein product, partial [Strongylus vulgaris]